MSKFINYNNLEIPNIIYKDPINKLSMLLNNNKSNVEPLMLFTPIMRVKSVDENEIILDLNNNSKFYDFLRRIDELNITNCYYNSMKWFNKDFSLETIEDYYKSPIDNNKTELKLKIPINHDKEIKLDYILDENKDYVNVHSIKENKLVLLNIKYVGIKFKSKSFEPIITIKSIKICDAIKKQSSLYNESSDDDLSDDSDF